MGWPIYSERFLLIGLGVEDLIYTVPAGHRAVVRSITASSWTTTAALVQVMVGGSPIALFHLQAQWESHALAVHVPLYAGESLRLVASVADIYASASGYLFADSSGRSAALGDVAEGPGMSLLPAP